MLTREQIQALIAIRNRPGSMINPRGCRLPIDIIKKIANVGFDPDPNSDTVTLLRLVAFGDLANVRAMLDNNPSLIGKAGHVVTPSGMEVRYVKPYECALGAGNFEMAKLIAGYFDQFTDTDGAEEKVAQDKKYLPHIEVLAKQLEAKEPAYDVASLIQQIIDAPDSEVTAVLNKSQDLTIPLCKAIREFRDAVRPQEQQTAGLHYQHYTTIQQVLDLLDEKWQSLSKTYTNFARCDLVWRQLFGFLARSLSFPERCALARACQDNEQTLVCKYRNQQSFPEFCDRSSEGAGLGFDFAIYGHSHAGNHMRCPGVVRNYLKSHIKEKTISLLRLCSQHPSHSQTKGREVNALCAEMIGESNTLKL